MTKMRRWRVSCMQEGALFAKKPGFGCSCAGFVVLNVGSGILSAGFSGEKHQLQEQKNKIGIPRKGSLSCVLPALLQKLVGESFFFLIFRREIRGEFCGIFRTTK